MQRTTIPEYFSAISERLQRQAQSMTPIITHHGEKGDNDHAWFTDLVRQYIPSRFGVDTGFVVNVNSDIGPQSDILILDTHNNTPLCSEKVFRVCPIEMVLGLIEFTRNLTKKKLIQELGKIATVRALARTKCYRKGFQNGAEWLRPRSYIVGLKSDITIEHIQEEVNKIDDNDRPNGILLINDDTLYLRHPKTLTFTKYNKDSLFHFLAILRDQISTFPTGLVDLGKYVPAVAEILKEPEVEPPKLAVE